MSLVFRNIDPPSHSPPGECPPRQQRRGVHTRRAERGVGGSTTVPILQRLQLCTRKEFYGSFPNQQGKKNYLKKFETVKNTTRPIVYFRKIHFNIYKTDEKVKRCGWM